MKKYYSTLSKEKKLKVKDQYTKEYKDSDLDKQLNRLVIYSILGYVVAIFIIVYAIIKEDSDIWSLVIGITLFVASTVFIIGRCIIKRNVLNKIALKNK